MLSISVNGTITDCDISVDNNDFYDHMEPHTQTPLLQQISFHLQLCIIILNLTVHQKE